MNLLYIRSSFTLLYKTLLYKILLYKILPLNCFCGCDTTIVCRKFNRPIHHLIESRIWGSRVRECWAVPAYAGINVSAERRVPGAGCRCRLGRRVAGWSVRRCRCKYRCRAPGAGCRCRPGRRAAELSVR